MWVKPIRGPAAEDQRRRDEKFEIRQHHKQFDPHVLAVQAGSIVSFPNLDPFFHNVLAGGSRKAAVICGRLTRRPRVTASKSPVLCYAENCGILSSSPTSHWPQCASSGAPPTSASAWPWSP